jgi:multidrug transporter EmrE-like cation transporter
MIKIILILFAAIFNVMAQVSLKFLASQIKLEISIHSLYLTIFNKFFFLGIFFYIISLFLSIKIFETSKFSYVIPIFIAFVFILTSLISIFVFKENMTFSKCVGFLLILAGVYFVR